MKIHRFGKGSFKTFQSGIEREWVITNGLGGYAGSSMIGAHTRKHHGLLIASLHPPVERYLLLSKLEESIVLGGNTYSFATNQRPGWLEEGQKYLQRFTFDGLPTFLYSVEGVFITKTISFEYGKNTVAISYTIENGPKDATFNIVPFFNYRSHHDRSERATLNFHHSHSNNTITLTPIKNDDLTISLYVSEGAITSREDIYDSDMELQTEINTGMSCIENNFTPYDISIAVKPYEVKNISVICSVEDNYEKDAIITIARERERLNSLIAMAGYNDEFVNNLVLASDNFIVQRQSTGYKTVLAGLPWFTDWGRDTMLSLQGLTLITKRYEDTKEILRSFSKYIHHGLVPNMFPDGNEAPIYNTVDASLWYFYSIDRYLTYVNTEEAYDFVKTELFEKLKEIMMAYQHGTDFSIHMESDGLIHAGDGHDQVTWMDVRVGDWVVTPRHGKPVEINALWYNALKVMEQLSTIFKEDSSPYELLANKVKESFLTHFWNEDKNCLYDVISDTKDDSIRPNQIYAVSLPYTMLPPEKEKLIVEAVISNLYANHGLRSLAPSDKEYHGIYFGKLHDRDAAYHQGTAWVFPLGALITAYTKVHQHSKESIAYAKKLLGPLEDHLEDGCIGSIAEIFDGDEPNISRGCYAQAWSVGEILRAYVEDILTYEFLE